MKTKVEPNGKKKSPVVAEIGPGKLRRKLRVPKHRYGKLSQGNPGNKGGGRLPDVLRAEMRLILSGQLSVLTDIAEGRAIRRMKVGKDGEEVEAWVSPEPGDRIRALDVLAKYGLGTQQEVSADVTNRTVSVEWIKEA